MRALTFLLILLSVFHFGLAVKYYQLASYNESYDAYLATPIENNYEKLSLLQFYDSIFGIEFKAQPPVHNYEYEQFSKNLNYYCTNTYKTWEQFRVDYLTKFFPKVRKEFVLCIDNIEAVHSTQGVQNTFIKQKLKFILDECDKDPITEMRIIIRSREEYNRVQCFNKLLYNNISPNQYSDYVICYSNFHKNINRFNSDSFKGDFSNTSETNMLSTYPLMTFMKLAMADILQTNDIRDAIYEYLNIKPQTNFAMKVECISNRSYASMSEEKYKSRQSEYNDLAIVPDTYKEFADLNKAIDAYFDVKSKEIYNELFKNSSMKKILLKLQEVPHKEIHRDYMTYMKYAKINDTKYMYMYGLFKKNLDLYARRIPLGVRTWIKNE